MTRPQEPPAPPAASTGVDHFAGMYLAKDDPWDNATGWHDRRKYAVTAASLPRERYRRGYEPACAVGELTRLLAARCDELHAVDAVDTAVAQARAAVAGLAHVRVERAVLPADAPAGVFDLVVVGDLLYYLDERDLADTLDVLLARLEPGGDLVAVHFRDRAGGTWDGAGVHRRIAARPELAPLVHHDDEWFVLDVWRRTG